MIPSIEGAEQLTASRLLEEIPQGGRFASFTTCISVGIATFRQASRIQYLSPRTSPLASGFRHVWPTFLMGWWGLRGPSHTIEAVREYLHGGTDLTPAVLAHAEHVFHAGFGTPEELQALKRLGAELAIRASSSTRRSA